MLFTCTKDNLLKGLQVSAGIANKPSNLPILSNIFIEATETGVELVSTNLEIAVKAHIRAKVEEVGSFTVPAKTFLDYVNLLRDEQVHVSLDGTQLIVSGGNASTKIKGESAEDFPVMPDIDRQFEISLPAKELKDAFSKVGFAASKNEIRPELSGVFCAFFAREGKDLVMAATDSYRLSENSISLKDKKDAINCIIPGKTVAEFGRLLSFLQQTDKPVQLAIGEGQVSLVSDGIEMVSRLIDGTYPDYTQIIPTQFQTTVEVHKDVLINSIKAAGLFTATGVNAMRLEIDSKGSTLTVTSTSTQTGEHAAALDAVVSGDNSSIVLNHRYVLDGLQHIEEDVVSFQMNGPDAPCIFKGKESDQFIYIVMPIRQ